MLVCPLKNLLSAPYRGYYYDAETGFYYLNSRYYDPEIGRFINADGLIDQSDFSGYNLFAYCGNNPVMRTDPSGHCFMLITATIGAVAGAIIGGIIAAKNGNNVWAGIGIGAAAGVLLAGSATASTAAVVTGAGVLISQAC